MSTTSLASTSIAEAILKLHNGESGKGFLTIRTLLGDEFSLAVPGTHVRLMIVLNEARQRDHEHPPSLARGWLKYDELIKALAVRFNDVELLRKTIISYAYRLQRKVLLAALDGGIATDDLVFVERVNELGARLTVPLSIIDPGAAAAPASASPRLPR
jgi:hypothetical protein